MLRRTSENIKDPLFRFFEREVNAGARLLSNVRSELTDIVMVCEAKKKQTNYLRSLTSDLAKGTYMCSLSVFVCLFVCLCVHVCFWEGSYSVLLQFNCSIVVLSVTLLAFPTADKIWWYE